MAPNPPTILRKPVHPALSTTSRPPHKLSKAPTKRLKRDSKHATLLSRISKTAPASKISKRRRPSKKLVTDLDGLADALPEAPISSRNGTGNREGAGKIKHKSLKSRPGAGKKKERLVAMEMERFGWNMARMCAGDAATSRTRDKGEGEVVGERSRGIVKGEGGSKERWAAIRGFISQTMERRPDEVVGR